MFQQRYCTDPETGMLDYDGSAQAQEFKPLVLIAGYSAYARRVNFAKMREIADEVGATLMVDMAHFAGLVAGKVFTGDEDPVPFAHVTTTTTHKSLRGPRGGMVLATEEYAAAVGRGCPMVPGGPLSHIMAAKAVALAEARQPSFRTYAQGLFPSGSFVQLRIALAYQPPLHPYDAVFPARCTCRLWSDLDAADCWRLRWASSSSSRQLRECGVCYRAAGGGEWEGVESATMLSKRVSFPTPKRPPVATAHIR